MTRQHIQALEDLTRASAIESEALSELSKRTQQDSRIVKMLTIVASIYLPAALVASVFSSNLVETVDAGTMSSNATHFQLATQFWMYPVFTLALVVVTLVPVGIWIWFSVNRNTVAKVWP
jgi:uncharacterized membrane protein